MSERGNVQGRAGEGKGGDNTRRFHGRMRKSHGEVCVSSSRMMKKGGEKERNL